MKQLIASVGKDGKNYPNDVQLVRALLNDNIGRITPLRILNETGACDVLVIAAVECFQRRVLKMTPPDGLVDPGGRTFKRLSENHPGFEWSGDSSKWTLEKKLASMNPAFRSKASQLLQRLKGQGFRPKVFFAWRSVDVQRELKRQGRTKVDFSFHNATIGTRPNAYAADIIDERYAWSSKPETKVFWDALGKEAKALGLVWGGDWKSFRDLAHVQLLPNSDLSRIREESGR